MLTEGPASDGARGALALVGTVVAMLPPFGYALASAVGDGLVGAVGAGVLAGGGVVAALALDRNPAYGLAEREAPEDGELFWACETCGGVPHGVSPGPVPWVCATCRAGATSAAPSVRGLGSLLAGAGAVRDGGGL